MRKIIYRSLFAIVSIAVLITAVIVTGVSYRQICVNEKRVLREHLETTVDYINNTKYDSVAVLKEMYEGNDIKVKLFDASGKELYNNGLNENDKINLKNIEFGRFIEKTESSDGFWHNIYFCATMLNNGNMIIMSETIDSVLKIFFEGILAVLPGMIAILVVALWSSNKITKRILKPINEMNLDDINGENVYEELKPFFSRIKNQKEQNEQIEKLRREFSANVSHELKTPLTSISGYAQMINNGMAKKEDYLTFTKKIEKESSRLILLVNDIIKLSNLDEHEHFIANEIIDLNEIVKDVLSSLEDVIHKKSIHIFYSGEKALIKGSKTLIGELVYNLLDNAVKYNKENGNITIYAGNTEKGIELSVRDTGIGIAEEEQERIFERFYRVDKSHSKTVGGTGLGLSIVKHVAMCHDAKINVDSKLGEGTTISVIFDAYA